MLDSIFTSMSGMKSFDKGLDNISSNVSNMNTNAYKKTDLHFRDFLYKKDQNSNGTPSALDASFTSVDYSQGEIKSTDRDMDLAIDGRGYFVLRDGDKKFYTRLGEFDFDKDGYLISKFNGYRVAGISDSGSLSDINISNSSSSGSDPTSLIELSGNLSTSGQRHTINNVTIYDIDGSRNELILDFKNDSANTPLTWIIEVKDKNGKVISQPLIVKFNANGSPKEGFNKVSFDFLSSTTQQKSTINISLGQPNKFGSVTNFSGGSTSTVKSSSVDGAGPGIVISKYVDENGSVILNYSNGKNKSVASIGIAQIGSSDDLESLGSGLFKVSNGNDPVTSKINGSGFGVIRSKKIESSNVDLTSEFTEMIIVQRGYQASSQILSGANEMLQQLLESTGK